jgi:hypothetical protein
MVSFDVPKADVFLIRQIAERADSQIFQPNGVAQSVADTMMDIQATIAQGVPLRLEELLAADAFNFAHDICGIYRHIDRATGKLGGCFSPRFAA